MKLKPLLILSVVIFTIGFALQANAQTAKPSCSVEKTAGDWAFQGSGKLADGSDALTTGTYHLDKDGTSSSHLISSIGGVLLVEFDATGKTTVEENCLLTQIWDDGVTPLSRCVVFNNNNEIWCVYDKPMFFKVELKRIHPRE